MGSGLDSLRGAWHFLMITAHGGLRTAERAGKRSESELERETLSHRATGSRGAVAAGTRKRPSG